MNRKNKRLPDRPRVLGTLSTIGFPLVCGVYNYYNAKSQGRKNAANAYRTMALISGAIQAVSSIGYYVNMKNQ